MAKRLRQLEKALVSAILPQEYAASACCRLAPAVLLVAGVLEVRGKQGLGHEPLLAVRAHVGALARVVALVDHQRGPLRERLPARLALVRPLASVNALMQRQVAGLAERLATVGARVRLLPRVDAPVQVQVVLVGQRLAANITDEHVLAGVRFDVQGERVAVREHLAAGLALVYLRGLLLVRVDCLLVGGQVSRVGEGLPAHVALKGLLTRVEVLVLHEPGVHEEPFAADLAVVLELLAVAPLVRVERRLVDGRVVALVALQLLLLRVLALVHLHLVRPLVGLVAHVAGVGPLLGVHHLVHLERLLRAELLVALRALEHGQVGGHDLVLAARVHLHLDGGRHRRGALDLLLLLLDAALLAELRRRDGRQQGGLVVHLPVLREPLPAGEHQVAVGARVAPGGAAQRSGLRRQLEHGCDAVGLLC